MNCAGLSEKYEQITHIQQKYTFVPTLIVGVDLHVIPKSHKNHSTYSKCSKIIVEMRFSRQLTQAMLFIKGHIIMSVIHTSQYIITVQVYWICRENFIYEEAIILPIGN